MLLQPFGAIFRLAWLAWLALWQELLQQCMSLFCLHDALVELLRLGKVCNTFLQLFFTLLMKCHGGAQVTQIQSRAKLAIAVFLTLNSFWFSQFSQISLIFHQLGCNPIGSIALFLRFYNSFR